jgi:hydroxyethylthiazole kinase
MLWHDLRKIRAEAPLTHNITNYVAMNITANALLAIGASPVMAHAAEEVEEMVALARALVINIGTLSTTWIDSMIKAGREARRRGIPIILDPVGAGATKFRTATARDLLREICPAIVRGNASEIRSLVFAEHSTKGVDSTHSTGEALDAAQEISRQHYCVVSLSGERDLIVSGKERICISNGHPMMPRVTGLGCTATAITGAFAAVNSSYFQAAAHAMALMGIAGEMAAEKANGPGSFQPAFLDTLYSIQEPDIDRRLRMETI